MTAAPDPLLAEVVADVAVAIPELFEGDTMVRAATLLLDHRQRGELMEALDIDNPDLLAAMVATLLILPPPMTAHRALRIRDGLDLYREAVERRSRSNGADATNAIRRDRADQRNALIRAAWAALNPELSETTRVEHLRRRRGWSASTIRRAIPPTE